MFPNMRNRIVIAAAVVVGAFIWLRVADYLAPADGSSGFALTTARVGFVTAALLVAFTGLPAMGLGLITSTVGNLVSGLFAVSMAVCVLAWRGGAIDGWMFRVDLPGGYLWLIIEMAVWLAGVVAMLLMIQTLRSPMRTRWPALGFEDHLGVDTDPRLVHRDSALAGAGCAAIGAVLSWLLLRNSDPSQITFGLLTAFTVGGLMATLKFPNVNPAGILVSPGIVAVLGYGYVLLNYADGRDVLAAWHAGTLPGPALALPIHYIGAGVTGCTLGIGWAQALHGSEELQQKHKDAMVLLRATT